MVKKAKKQYNKSMELVAPLVTAAVVISLLASGVSLLGWVEFGNTSVLGWACLAFGTTLMVHNFNNKEQ